MTPVSPLTAPAAALVYVLNAGWELPLIAFAGLAILHLSPSRVRRGCSVWAAVLSLGVLAPALSAAAWALEPRSGRHAADVATHLPEHGRTAVLLVGAAVLTTVLAVLRLAAGWWRVHRLVVRSTPVQLAPRLAARLRLFAERHGRAVPSVRICRHLASPSVAGVWRPVVLLPMDFERWGEEEACAALLHECAHVLRRDYLSNLVCEVMALPVSWHPVIYLLKRPLRAGREVACDRLAAQEFGGSLPYARALLRIAAGTAPRDPALLAPRLIDSGGLEGRVRALLTPPARLGALGRVRLCAAALAGVVLLAPLICLRFAPEEQPNDLHTVARVPAFSTVARSARHLAVQKLARRARLTRFSAHVARTRLSQPASVDLARVAAPKHLNKDLPEVVLVRADPASDDGLSSASLRPLLLLLTPSSPPCAAPQPASPASSMADDAAANDGVDVTPPAPAAAPIPPSLDTCSKPTQFIETPRAFT
jgi:beta-lactamase regulating signal transducer with metallopeptidase domain